MEEAKAEQDDEVQQRKGNVVLEVAEAAAHLRRKLSALVCGMQALKSGAHRRPLGRFRAGVHRVTRSATSLMLSAVGCVSALLGLLWV